MSEDAPKGLERKPATYEQALNSVRSLHAAGVINPLDMGDPRTRESLDIIDDWYHSCNLHMRGVGTPEKAADIVRAARLWIDAGYGGIEHLNAAKEKLADEHADALREGNAEVSGILRFALQDIERAVGRNNPEAKPPVIVTAKLEEAKAYVEQGKITDAIGVLTLAMYDTRFKSLPAAELEPLQNYRDSLKTRLT